MKAVISTGQIFGGIEFAFCMFADYRLPSGMSWFWLSIFYGRHSLLDPVRATKNRSEPSVYASFPFPGWISNPNPNDMGELVWKAGGFVAPFFSLGSLLFSASAIRKESEITENSAQKYHWIQIGSAGNSYIKHCPLNIGNALALFWIGSVYEQMDDETAYGPARWKRSADLRAVLFLF